ncbi:MAG: hypothetical protein SFX73_16035 [Kofleriaceae bacterium]|nr:hypothetical protein [Kofleriaceae bacterium]
MRAVLLLLALAACQRVEPRAQDLGKRLAALAHCAPGACEREVKSWKLDRAEWDRLVVDPYRGEQPYARYARAFDEAVPALAAQLRAGGGVAVRSHFAGDPRNTLGQARARWAVPVQYPSKVVELGGKPLDVVFDVDRQGRVHAITGIDRIINMRAAKIDPVCAADLAAARTGKCLEIAWVLADAALRDDVERFTRSCALAAGLCAGDRKADERPARSTAGGSAELDRGMPAP